MKMRGPERQLRSSPLAIRLSAGGQSASRSRPTLSFTLSAASSTLSLTLESARSILPSRFSFSSSVRSPAASLVRPFASSMRSPILIAPPSFFVPQWGTRRSTRKTDDMRLPARDDQRMSPATRERMSVDDAEVLRLESAAIKGHTGKVLILAPDSAAKPLSVPALRTRVGERMGTFPRLVQRVEEPRLGLGRPVWAPVDYVDLDWHVAEPDRADPLSDEELRHAVGDLLAERLDHTRPLWRIDA